MRTLLDESVHRGVKGLLTGQDVTTVKEHGWSSIENGELLRRASEEFDVLVTADRVIPHQQNLTKFDIAVVILVASSNRIEAYEPLARQLHEAIEAQRWEQQLMSRHNKRVEPASLRSAAHAPFRSTDPKSFPGE